MSHERSIGTPVEKLGFREYRRRYWKDWILLICTAVLGFGLYVAPPAPNRVFPIYENLRTPSTQPSTDAKLLVDAENAYPIRPEIIPMWLSGFLSFILCFLTFAIAQYWKRSWTDFHTAMMGMFYSMGGSGLFQVFCKWLIGGFRPHFLQVCKPDLSNFPSGHSNSAWAGLLILCFYLNLAVKLYSDGCTSYLKSLDVM
ncbi:hypothetical protein K7432_013798 [Basidiobolus ranarum]|uniref:Phosphatidic acid phosphatase type 2/haloperoxidase domain-containing protein n=1 Tax=Basidiobolus ranarum TaxID=34480 RepID=A0ABR2WIM0_9FUNG